MRLRKEYEVRSYIDTAVGAPIRVHAVVRRSESVHETLSYSEAVAVCNALNKEFERINDAEQELNAKKRRIMQLIGDTTRALDDALMSL